MAVAVAEKIHTASNKGVLVAARAPCDVFDQWVRWERGQLGCDAPAPAASGNPEICESGNPAIWIPKSKNIRMNIRSAQSICKALLGLIDTSDYARLMAQVG